jgi:hypothetical protein
MELVLDFLPHIRTSRPKKLASHGSGMPVKKKGLQAQAELRAKGVMPLLY